MISCDIQLRELVATITAAVAAAAATAATYRSLLACSLARTNGGIRMCVRVCDV